MNTFGLIIAPSTPIRERLKVVLQGSATYPGIRLKDYYFLEGSQFMSKQLTKSSRCAFTADEPVSGCRRRASSVWSVLRRLVLILLAVFICTEVTLQLAARESQGTQGVLSQLQNIPAATLSDAIDQVVGRRGFMSYDMRPISLKKRMAGRAKTVLGGL